MPCIAYRRGYLPSTFALLSRLSASPLPLSPSPLFLLSTSRLRLYPSLHSSPSTSPLLRFFASPPTRPVSPGTLSSSCLPLQMPRINYLVLGSTKIGVIVDIAQDLPVQALVDVVFNARSFNCKPADLQVYRVDVPLTEAGIPPQYTPGVLNQQCNAETRMERFLDIGKFFGVEQFSAADKHKVQVVIRVPDVQVQAKRPIADVFPQGIVYEPPRPEVLLHGPGKVWGYQPGEDLEPILREAIKDHYWSFRNGYIDKSYMPIYFFLSGAGTGKSRHAAEFHKTSVHCLGDEDEELKGKLCNAWIFHTTFENGTSLRSAESDGFRAIGTRMLYQLLPNEKLKDILENYEAPDPWSVLQLVAKGEQKELKDSTVILIVDGLHALMVSDKDGQDKTSEFYKTLTAIGDLTHEGAFLLPCCTAIISSPITSSLRASNRKRVYLPVTSLEPPALSENGVLRPVFDPTDTILQILLEDCGGHGRAIELLWTLTRNDPTWKSNISGFMRNLRRSLLAHYELAFRTKSKEVQAIVQAVFSHQILRPNDEVSSTGKCPDQLVAPGLVRYEIAGNGGYLHVPYIWLWAMAGEGGQLSQLPGWDLDDYQELLAGIDPTLPSNCSWENFKKFVARFRCLKSLALQDNHLTKISEIHHGARLNGDVTFTNHHLALVRASKQIATSTTNANRTKWLIHSSGGHINIRGHKHIILNTNSADSGDTVLSLDAGSPVNEVHQYKYYSESTSFTQAKYNIERDKAASVQDFFLLYTTKPNLGKISLPKNSGIVCGDNWREYFGPFAGRAFLYRSAIEDDRERGKGFLGNVLDRDVAHPCKFRLAANVRQKRGNAGQPVQLQHNQDIAAPQQ